ncbi:MAG: branched-chain amino acid ABC transporter substrate-binding protein [Ktedonobacterales bacterium]
MRSSTFMRAAVRVSLVAVFAAGLSLAACGPSSSSGNKDLVIGTLLPVSGTDAGVGLPTQYGADLAISQNADLGNGYKLSVLHENYDGANGADTSIGAADATTLINNTKVVAVVGPFNSGIAKVTIPITNGAGLTMISPTNTNPGLTKEPYAAANDIIFSQLHPAGKPDAYFRTCGTDDVQGKVDGDVAAAAPVNGTKAYVVDDSTVYGKGLALQFTNEFKAKGGTVVGTAEITATQISTAPQLASQIISAGPDVVFYGGVTSQGGGALKKDLFDKGYTKPMVGGDGIADDPQWLVTAGDGAVNTFGTVAAPGVSTLTSAAATKFKSDYTSYVAGKPNNDLLPYSVQAYDDAMIEITAIKSLISAGKDVTRANVRDAVAGINYNGLTGNIHFDSNGDNAGTKVFSVYTVDNTKQWVFLSQVTA